MEASVTRKLPKNFVIFLFALSGFSSLVYEIVWARMLSLVFGSTVEAVSAVITAFMFGLSLGSYIAGRFSHKIRNSLKLYAVIEALIGLMAIILYYLIVNGMSIDIALHHLFGESSIIPKILFYSAMFFFIAIPTTMMGATYPVMSRFFIRESGETGRGVGIVYGLNTAGAVAGAFAGGFFLIPLLGIRNTTFFAVIINLLIFVSVFIIIHFCSHREDVPLHSKEVKSGDFLRDGTLIFFIAIFSMAGFTSMVYEVAWTRLLTMVIGNSVYAFSSILTIFLLGTAMGSIVISRYADRIKRVYLAFCFLEAGIFFFVLALLYSADLLPIFFLELFRKVNPSFINIELITFLIVIMVVFIPTFLMGAIFPVFNRIFISRWGDVTSGVGNAYSANTLGGIFGALIAGFYYIPSFGVQKTILLTAGINLFIGLAVAIQSPHLQQNVKSLIIVAFGSFFAFYSIWVPRWDNKIMNLGVYIYAEWYKYADEEFHIPFKEFAHERELLFFEEGKGSTVAVTKTDTLSLQINGKTDAGTTKGDMITQTMLSALPLILHDKPRRVAIIGLGSGVSLGVAEDFPLEEIDCFEILPSVVKANRFFSEINHNALEDPRVNLLMEDARHYFSYTDRKYDVIVSEPSNPWIKGMSNLFTKEFFAIAKSHLNRGGIMSQWLQTYSLSTENLRIILNTYMSVFPHASVWYFGGEDLILIGSMEDVKIDSQKVSRMFYNSRLRRDLRRIDFNSPGDILNGFLIGDTKLKRFTDGAGLNTDDNPVIEFNMPKSLYEPTATDNIKALKECC